MTTSVVSVPAGLLRPVEMGGSPDATTKAMAAFAVEMGAAVTSEKGETAFYQIASDQLSMDGAKYLFSKGGDVENYPTWIKIDDATDDVTAGLPDRTYTDQQGNTHTKTWEQWSGSAILDRGNQLYCCATNGSRYYKISELAPVINDLVSQDDLPPAPVDPS